MVLHAVSLAVYLAFVQFAVDGSSSKRDYYWMVKQHDLHLILDLLLCSFIILSWFFLSTIGQENGGNHSDLRRLKAFKTAPRKRKRANIYWVPTVFQAVLQKHLHVLSSQHICEVFILISTLQMKKTKIQIM